MSKYRLLADIYIIGMGACYIVPIMLGPIPDLRNPFFPREAKVEAIIIMTVVVLLVCRVVIGLIHAGRPVLFLMLLLACAPLILMELLLPLMLFYLGRLYWNAWPLLMWWWLHSAFYIAAWAVVWPWYRREHRAKRQMQLKTVSH